MQTLIDLWLFGAIFLAGLFLPGLTAATKQIDLPAYGPVIAYLLLVSLWPVAVPAAVYFWNRDRKAKAHKR